MQTQKRLPHETLREPEEEENMRSLRLFALAAGAALLTASAFAQGPSDVPRNQTLIVENPEGTIRNPGWFNYWAVNAGGRSTGLQQLAMDTFWYIDPDHGLDGVWDNSLASEPPIYNDDFTQMTVKLRSGIFWSDGVEFSADDVLFTINTHMTTDGLVWSAPIQLNVESVSAPDPNTVVFTLQRPNSRFHSLFTVRWNAMWMMPKHIFEGKDVLQYDFNPPVSLSAYTLHGFDPNGQWFTWEKREDWQRTSLGRFGEPGPQYVTYVDPGPPDKRVISQLNHELDIIHDTSPEGVFTLVEDSPTSIGWFDGFPYGHPDPTLAQVIFNHQNPKFQDPDVRWALALALDIKAIVMAGYRGAATISAIAVPPTGTHPDYYHQPMEEWVSNFELDTGQKVIRPYDPTIGQQIADMLRPSMGDQIPSDPEAIDRAFGLGWWRQDLEAAAQLLERAGFTRRGNDWYMPNGERFSIKVVVEGEARPVMTRGGAMVAEQWRRFGIDATTESAQAAFLTRRNGGDFETIISWSVETWGGHPDLSFFLDSWHSQFVQPAGSVQTPRNWSRYSSPELDAIIEEIRGVPFDDPRGIELANEFIKLAVREMPVIPLMSYNVFTMMDTTYWQGYPTADDPYTNPVPNWGNSRYMMVRLRPTE
jgi:peptide/nickel transport system substrate-binding protein